jgi:catechol 2,3-dioxygenase-like lactoylglutathione lyase family enzyme
MATALTTTGICFHISLNVSDLERSVKFYELLLGTSPAKCRDDYAKFELADPPLVLSLEPNRAATGGRLNHVGFRMADSEALVMAQRRLELAGIRTQREEGVECCYARQTKFWVTDPDQTLWEIYVLEEDLDHRGIGQAPHDLHLPETAAKPRASWQHRLTEPLPLSIPADDGALDDILLEGTLNDRLDQAERRRLLIDAFRTLRPGGSIALRMLVADRALPAGPLKLPGPAAVVRSVPVESEPRSLLEAAGFAGINVTTLSACACFVHEGVPLREMRISGLKPLRGSTGGDSWVVYRGPFCEVMDDEGIRYHRGVRRSVSSQTAEQLESAPYGGSFVILDQPKSKDQ